MADPIARPPTLALVAIATALAVVTYLESALLEYPLAGVGALGALAGLSLLVALQVVLVVLLVRTVRRSGDAYSVFFRRAALVALVAFLALTAAILVPEGAALVQRELGSTAASAWPPMGALG